MAITGAEPHSEELRCKIQDKLGIEVYNCYGMSEMNGPGVAFECIFRNGMHVWEDRYIVELLDPDTFEPVKEGETGELVLTILCRDAMAPYPLPDARPDALHSRAPLRMRTHAPPPRALYRPHRRHAHHQRRQRVSEPDRGSAPQDEGRRIELLYHRRKKLATSTNLPCRSRSLPKCSPTMLGS